jgi:hypothetical protein
MQHSQPTTPTTLGAVSTGGFASRPLQVFAACRARDLPVLEMVARWLPRTVPLKEFVVASPDRECRQIQARLGSCARVVPEGDFVPCVSLDALRALPVQGFPRAVGWYFQQLLKLQFSFVDLADDYYLIWDADTVPLRPMRFFDDSGRMLLTKAKEHHTPYFETYRRLLGEDPGREFSFIAQHILVQKSVAREMMARIEAHVPGDGNWAWKIMRSLPPQGVNLFSEYETYGHYVKNHYPDRVRFIERTWQRAMPGLGGCPIPTEAELQVASRSQDFAAYERASPVWRRWARRLREWFR